MKTINFLLSLSFCLSVPSVAVAQSTSLTLQSGEEPQQKAWTQPAQIAYSSAKGEKDSWALDAALRIQHQLDNAKSDQLVARTVVQINTKEKSKVRYFEGEVGYATDWQLSTNSPLYGYLDIKIGAKDKTIFADPKANCTATPQPAACGRQHETSVAGTVVIQPFIENEWENTFFIVDDKIDGPLFTHSFAPLITFYYDEILSAKTNASGIRPDGSVMGTKLELKTAFSPRFTSYRLVLKASGGWTYAAIRNSLRKENFPKSSTQFKLSADYELGTRSFESVSGPTLIPAIGITYTKGDDPLSGKLDQDNFVAAFKLTFRSK